MVLAAQGKKINQISIDEIDWLTKLRRGLEETRKGFVTELLENFGDDPLTEASDDALISKTTESYWNLKLGYGHEYRRGHNRLQGYYGWEAMIGLNTGSEDNPNRKYSYEFSHEDMFNAEAEIGEDGEDGSVDGDFFTALDSRKNGFGVNLGARTFVGVEYFAAPKISVGAEFGWGLAIEMNGRSSITETTFEDEEGTSEDEGLGNSGSNMSFDVDKFGGNLTIAFHF